MKLSFKIIFDRAIGSQAMKNLTKSLIVALLCLAGSLNAQTTPIASNLIDLNSTEGDQLLFASSTRTDYIPLSIEFITQENLAYCGVASIVMILNALDIPAPETPEYRNLFRIFTQDNVFDQPQTRQVIAPETVARQGMTLQELGGLLASYPVDVTVRHGADMTLEEFRRVIVDNLSEADNYVLVNYLRRSLGQKGGGHISPIAAFHEESDRLLILDVARYRYAPIWVKVEDLWQATNTLDTTSNKTRGLVLVSGQETGLTESKTD